MKKIKNGLIALLLALVGMPALAQTTNPATSKPNQNTPATTASPTTDKSVSPNTTKATSTRTDSVVTVPENGTSIATAPGTKKQKKRSKPTPTKNKKTNPY
ncbi:hypothetical protein HUW51_03655 [Adhaeribacter swui]|uniref:Uncharacterized protein n=1 Tax=Adhaeribacter swui TaxID=2086471 RepID=A0A7G7G3X4_9BACT|nr:hypothetical protein [Adhaeribacter swui]QNF31858.1 hypothetical protein HUW51_03655 [Adhaeribacter swui]